jgi:hypothetical protein
LVGSCIQDPLPHPVEYGDIVALGYGPPLPVVAVVDLDPGGSIDLLIEVDPAHRAHGS